MNRLKLCGERIMSRDPDHQTAEIRIRIAIMNRCSASEEPRSKLSPEARGERATAPCASINSKRPPCAVNICRADADPAPYRLPDLCVLRRLRHRSTPPTKTADPYITCREVMPIRACALCR